MAPELTTVPGPKTQDLSDGPDARARPRRFTLRVIAGPDEGKAFSSSAERAVVGTHRSCDLVLGDPTVSRFHFDVVAATGEPLLRDLDSRNGTRIDGVSVLQAHLRSGATIAIGRTQLKFEQGDEPAVVPISTAERFGLLVGRSQPMRRAFALLEKAAAGDATVLLSGETGTGKEAAAESLHRESPRRGGPFVVVDCGAIPADLLESELFGHEKGAFTGAVASREGAFEAASGGTIFLDEIGELSKDLQPKLLRVLERHEVKRVGSNKYVPVDVRVVAASNRDLKAEVNAKTFRSDLYYRLAVVEVTLPSLRQRPDDLPLLVDTILENLDAAQHPAAAQLRAPDFVAELSRHSWPGNVRELRNYLERCLTLREQAPLTPLPDKDSSIVDVSVPIKEARDRWLRPFERRYLDEILRRHSGNITAAARASGVDRITFYRLLWRHGLR